MPGPLEPVGLPGPGRNGLTPWVAEATSATNAPDFLTIVAGVLTEAAQRSDALVEAAFEGALSDERLEPLATSAEGPAVSDRSLDRRPARLPGATA